MATNIVAINYAYLFEYQLTWNLMGFCNLVCILALV